MISIDSQIVNRPYSSIMNKNSGDLTKPWYLTMFGCYIEYQQLVP